MANKFLQPQIPLLYDDDYIYPLTTDEQVIIKDGKRLSDIDITNKQDTLKGTNGQIVGFDANGNAEAGGVGGRNYVLNSALEKSLAYAATGNTIMYNLSDDIGRLSDQNSFIASFDCMASSAGTTATVDLRDSAGNYVTVQTTISPGTKWARYAYTLQKRNNYTFENLKTLRFILRGGGTLYVRNIKLEYGLVATDWSPAPEDIESLIPQNAYTPENPPAYPVESVNGKTGKVNLSASDVNARPSEWLPNPDEIGAVTPWQAGETYTLSGMRFAILCGYAPYATEIWFTFNVGKPVAADKLTVSALSGNVRQNGNTLFATGNMLSAFTVQTELDKASGNVTILLIKSTAIASIQANSILGVAISELKIDFA